MSWLLDADVLCQPAKSAGNPLVIEWLKRERTECYTSSIVIAQVAYWVRTKEGRHRTRLQSWFRLAVNALEGRILSFNLATAQVWADQKAMLDRLGKPMPLEDSYIAAIARRHGLVIVTGNERDFDRPGLKVFNPFKLPH